MEILNGIFIIVLYLVIFVLLRIVTTFIHEMGHAIPALLYTDEPVTIYIGSYGDISNSLHFAIGRLHILFQFNVLTHAMGLCAHDKVKFAWQEFLVIMGGPTFSVLLSIPLLLMLYFYEFSQGWIIIFTMFIISAVLDFFVNIIPRNERMVLHNGQVTYNDGTQLLRLYRKMSKSQECTALEKSYAEGYYAAVVTKGQALLDEGQHEKGIYEVMIQAYNQTQQYEEALSLYEDKKAHFPLADKDYYQLGHIHKNLRNYAKALQYFDQYKYKHFQDAKLLYDMGSIKLEQGRYPEALKDLDAAIHYSPKYIDAYLLRGHSKIERNNMDGAYQDFMLAQNIDNQNPKIPYYLGLYHEAKRDYRQALQLYKAAKELRLQGFDIEEKIDYIERQLFG